MNVQTQPAIPTIPGTPFEGGFYAGRFMIGADEFALIVSPKEAGEHAPAPWGEYPQDVAAARSCNDGLGNTQAMAEAGSPLAQWALSLQIDGHADWYLPSRDELELCYRHLKPTDQENWCSFRDGDNPSSVPVGYPYTEESPEQTAADALREDAGEAFEAAWYWASTQCSPYVAWIQVFSDGNQLYGHKDNAYRARAVRRFKVTP